MKRKIIVMLCTLVCFNFLTTSCKKDAGFEDTLFVAKLKNSEYLNYLCFSYNSKKGVTGYIDSSDADSYVNNIRFDTLNKDYVFIYSFKGSTFYKSVAYSDITVTEYKEIWKATEGKDIRDTLTSRVIDTDPYAEVYEFLKMKQGFDLYEDIRIYNYNYFVGNVSKEDSIAYVKTRDSIWEMLETCNGVKRLR